MDQPVWAEVDEYLTAALVGNDAVLDAAQAATAAAGMPAISVSPPQGRLLEILVRSIRARRILEIGTLGGYSTIHLARGMAPNGRIVTLEKEPGHADVARLNIARAGYGDVVDVRVGDALESLQRMTAERLEPFDLIFVDADKANIPRYFELSLGLAHPGSLIVVDNVIRDGEVIDANTTDPNTAGVRRFFDMLSGNSRVTATAVQTVGVKGYDGFAIAVVN